MLKRVLNVLLGCWLITRSVATNQGSASKPDLLPALQRQPLFHGSASYYLPAGEDWRPGGSTLISVLMADQPLQFRTDPTGSKSGLQSVRLLYKCSSTDADFKEVLLESSDQSSTHCRPLRPFVLERLSASLYRLTLLRENGVAFEQALRHSLEFRLRLSFYQGELESASLFVFNFDALTKIPEYNFADNPEGYFLIKGIRGNETCFDVVAFEWRVFRYLLTQRVDEFDFESNAGFRSAKLQLLRQEFLDALHQSEPMVRNLLYLTVFYSRNCSDSRQTPVALATAGLGGTVGRSSFKPLKHFLLDPDSGMLHITTAGLQTINAKLSKVKGILDACLSVSVKGGYWPYRLVLRITEALDYSLYNYNLKRRRRKSVRLLDTVDRPELTQPPVAANVSKIAHLNGTTSKKKHAELPASIKMQRATEAMKIEPTEAWRSPLGTAPPKTESSSPVPIKNRLKAQVSSRTSRASLSRPLASLKDVPSKDCLFPNENRSSVILLPANLFNVSLACPVYCLPERIRVFVNFVGQFCSSSQSDGTDLRPWCSSLFSVQSDSCEIELMGPTSHLHAGNYTIVAGGAKYTYLVSVVSLPVFTADSLSSEVIDFNPKFRPANLRCAVSYHGVEPVDLRPQFKLIERFKSGSRWMEVSPRVFGSTVLHDYPKSVIVSINQTEMRSEMHIRVESKMQEVWWVSWKAAFECSASASKTDAKLFGLSEYQVKAAWNLAFKKYLELESNIRGRAAARRESVLDKIFLVLCVLTGSCAQYWNWSSLL